MRVNMKVGNDAKNDVNGKVENVEKLYDVDNDDGPVKNAPVESLDENLWDVRVNCEQEDYKDGWCVKHGVELDNVKTRKKTWTRCKNDLYRNVYKLVKTWKCPAENSDKITKPLTPISQGKLSCQVKLGGNFETFNSDSRHGKRTRGDKLPIG